MHVFKATSTCFSIPFYIIADDIDKATSYLRDYLHDRHLYQTESIISCTRVNEEDSTVIGEGIDVQ